MAARSCVVHERRAIFCRVFQAFATSPDVEQFNDGEVAFEDREMSRGVTDLVLRMEVSARAVNHKLNTLWKVSFIPIFLNIILYNILEFGIY